MGIKSQSLDFMTVIWILSFWKNLKYPYHWNMMLVAFVNNLMYSAFIELAENIPSMFEIIVIIITFRKCDLYFWKKNSI